MNSKIKAVIFDLDGTLLDTLNDLAASINHALTKFGYPERTLEEVRQFVGNGYKRLVELAIPGGIQNKNFLEVLDEGKSWYSEHCNDTTKPYDGILDTLKSLKNQGIKLAIVSNKPDPQVKVLAKKYFSGLVDQETSIGENEDLGIKRKPAPDSLLHVLKIFGLEKEEAIYVGDSEVDILTARNAGMDCTSVDWGFRSRDTLVENGATRIISRPEELLYTNDFLTGDIARDLDFYRIRQTISENCISEEGKEELLKREPTQDKEQIDLYKKLGREWTRYLSTTRPQPISNYPAVRHLFRTLGIPGAQLNQQQLFALGLFCISQTKLMSSIKSAAIELDIPTLNMTASTLPDLNGAKEEIFSVLTNDGEIRDLPVLREIRSRIASLHKEIENAIRKYTSDSTLSNVLQSNVPAYRAERELLAVRADHRSEIKGIVHEVSTSGSTVYIEPEEIVRANNELIQEEARLSQELKKIFRELTEKLGGYKESFIQSHHAMLLLETTYAGAIWGRKTDGIYAEDCDLEKEPPRILEARHPLLGEKAVPVSITFLDGKRVLIITGPNTGGKTVTLKTVALFALLNQAGFPLPAGEGTRIPIFSGVFADIGDEQSIDQSLSTFSSHMKKSAQMINGADENSLVLLDELASGTDPQEGGAIAMATLDSLIEKKSFVLVTTHHGILKNYGYTNPSCVNASVEFDQSTLKPTYRLLMGVPGESHAIDIALRSGLPEAVVAKAREYISTEQADVSTLIKGLTAKHTELDSLILEQKNLSVSLEQKDIKLKEREIHNKEFELELRERERTNASEFLRNTRRKLENLVRELREGEITREKTLGVKDFISDLTLQVEKLDADIQADAEKLEVKKEETKKQKQQFLDNGMKLSQAKERNKGSSKKTKRRLSNTEALSTAVSYIARSEDVKEEKIELVPGLEILAGSARRKGTLVSRNKNGTWVVQFGSMKMSVNETQIIPAPQEGKPRTASIVVETVKDEKTDDKPKFELRLLGMRYEEAIKALERQLDLCTIHNFKNFSIIHGKGSGILQQGVQNFLSHYPGIKSFHFASPEDGGTGKTYVELD